jgi:hypothetical protein
LSGVTLVEPTVLGSVVLEGTYSVDGKTVVSTCAELVVVDVVVGVVSVSRSCVVFVEENQ